MVMVTKGEDVFCNRAIALEDLAPCTQEEVDKRIFVHTRHAVTENRKALKFKANDTDVVVIAISVFPSLKELGLEKMWIAFGQGKNLRWIQVHKVVNTIGPENTRGLPFFHAFTGCDVVSAFRGRGKKCAWQTWNVCKEVSKTFAKLSQCVPALDDTDLQNLEKFVVALYDRSSAAKRVNDAGLNLFAQKQRPYDAIPPTQSALRLHAKRAIFQGGIIWGRQLSPGLAPIVQRNGDGSEKTTLEKYARSTFHQLLQVVKNLLNVVGKLWTELYSFV